MLVCMTAISRIFRHQSARNLTDCLNLTSKILPLVRRLNPTLHSNWVELSLHPLGLSSQILYFGCLLAHLCLNWCLDPAARRIAGFVGMASGSRREERGNSSLYSNGLWAARRRSQLGFLGSKLRGPKMMAAARSIALIYLGLQLEMLAHFVRNQAGKLLVGLGLEGRLTVSIARLGSFEFILGEF